MCFTARLIKEFNGQYGKYADREGTQTYGSSFYKISI